MAGHGFIPQYSVERAFERNESGFKLWTTTRFGKSHSMSLPNVRYRSTMQRRQPIFTREYWREEIHDMRNIRRVKRVLPSRAHQNSSSIIRDHIHLSSAYQIKSHSNDDDGDVERRLLAQKEALVVSHGLGLAWRDWNESTRTMTVRSDGPLACLLLLWYLWIEIRSPARVL